MNKQKIIFVVIFVVILVTIALITLLPTPGPSEFPELSELKRTSIETAWKNLGRAPVHWAGTPSEQGDRYYGTYEGYDIFFLGGGQLMVETLIFVGDSVFGHSSSFGLYAHKDGIVVPLKDLYQDGKLSEESVAEAAKYHRAYERAYWTERNNEWNQKFPSEPRDYIPDWATEPIK